MMECSRRSPPPAARPIGRQSGWISRIFPACRVDDRRNPRPGRRERCALPCRSTCQHHPNGGSAGRPGFAHNGTRDAGPVRTVCWRGDHHGIQARRSIAGRSRRRSCRDCRDGRGPGRGGTNTDGRPTHRPCCLTPGRRAARARQTRSASPSARLRLITGTPSTAATAHLVSCPKNGDPAWRRYPSRFLRVSGLPPLVLVVFQQCGIVRLQRPRTLKFLRASACHGVRLTS